MLPLDCSSKKSVLLVMSLTAMVCGLAACSSTPPADAKGDKKVMQAKAPVAAKEKAETEGGEPAVEALPGPGARISPPPGAEKSKKERQAVDKLLAGLPDEARDGGELSIPADPALTPESTGRSAEERRRDFQARQTDEELTGGARSLDERHTKDLGDLDSQLKVTPEENAGQGPSFSRGIQKVKELFKNRSFEEALIETNELLHYYPASAQLLLMKGTLHQRLGQIDLALAAYSRAFEYEPSKKLKAQIDHLKRLVAERESLRKPLEGIVVPGGVEETKFIPGGH